MARNLLTKDEILNIADEKVAWAAWCGMPHNRRAGAKPDKRAFLKEHAETQAAIQAAKEIEHAKQTAANERKQARAKAKETPVAEPENGAFDFSAFPADVQAALKLALGIGNIVTPAVETDETPEYETPLEDDEAPQDAARAGMMWRLNVEGFLIEALDQALGADGALIEFVEETFGDDAQDAYIDQDVGKDVLTAHFGPLPARRARA